MILIVGLGNPGKKFQKTRHNIGFEIIDGLFTAHSSQFADFKFDKKFNAEISQGKINNQKIILAKPTTFMNESGESVKSLTNYYKIPAANLWIIHDDSDLPLGTIRTGRGISSAGHKGIQSIIGNLKTDNFIRFRIGIRPVLGRSSKEKAEKLVLKKFSKEEKKIVKKIIEKVIEIISQGLENNDISPTTIKI